MNNNSLDCCKAESPAVPTKPWYPIYDDVVKEQQKETDMYAKQVVSTEEDHGREYLDHRINKVYNEKYEELENKFELDGKSPKTVKEAKEWLKSGEYRYELPEFFKEDVELYGLSSYFRWGKKPVDRTGFEKAVETLCAAKQKAKDTIHVIEYDADRLKALEEFQAWTWTN